MLGIAAAFLGAGSISYKLARADAPDYVVYAAEKPVEAGTPAYMAPEHPYRDALIAQADTGSAALDAGVSADVAPAPAPAAASSPTLPNPAEQPQESASLILKLYKAGHLLPMIIVASFFLLVLLQRWIAWLRTGYRKLYVSCALASLGMLAERAADGTTPNLMMVLGALGVGLAMYMKTEGEPKK